jgi:hypothetical protein
LAGEQLTVRKDTLKSFYELCIPIGFRESDGKALAERIDLYRVAHAPARQRHQMANFAAARANDNVTPVSQATNSRNKKLGR